MVGPETNAYESAVMMTKSLRPMSSAGPETAGPVTMVKVGMTPEQLAIARAAWPQPCSAAMPSRMSAPEEAIARTSGIL